MKAIALVPGTTTVRLVDRPEPSIGAPDELKLRIVARTGKRRRAGARAPPRA